MKELLMDHIHLDELHSTHQLIYEVYANWMHSLVGNITYFLWHIQLWHSYNRFFMTYSLYEEFLTLTFDFYQIIARSCPSVLLNNLFAQVDLHWADYIASHEHISHLQFHFCVFSNINFFHPFLIHCHMIRTTSI